MNQAIRTGVDGSRNVTTPLLGKRGNPQLPLAALVTFAPGRLSTPHFHDVPQYQIMLGGRGKIGRREVKTNTVHFSRPHTPYGPFTAADDSSLTCLIIRSRPDTGAQHDAAAIAALNHMPNRNPWQVTHDVTFPDAGAQNVMLQAVPQLQDQHGLATYTLSMKPGAAALTPDPCGGHAGAWAQMKPLFDQEIAKCENANYEFSTLAANYIANIDFIDRDWLQGNLKGVFPFDFLNNFHCALEGLAYAPATRPVYALLAEGGILDFGLRQEAKGRHAREKIVERIALAFLWGDEELDGPRFSYLFEVGRIDDLEQATTFFWSVSNQDLSKSQVERILSFWARCVTWSRGAAEPPEKLLSKLGRLSCYIKTIGEHEREWLLAVAPYVHIGYDADDFIEELERLADISPENVSAVLGKVLDTFVPTFDFQDRLKSLLTKLAAHGRREEAIAYADRLRHLRGMEQLFGQLTAGA
ncbi:MAG: hypothetical protein FJY56_03170 [Betaproteobacteria bacterium]|nr:hypothetical protein [Betaproteobacteria bacterium]